MVNVDRRYHLYSFLFILACYGLVAGQFQLFRAETRVQDPWGREFSILFAASLAFSVLLFIFRTHRYGRLLFIPKAIVFLLFTNVVTAMGYGTGIFWGLETSLLALLVVEISVHFDPLPSALLTCLLIGLSIMNLLVTGAVDPSFSRIAPRDLLLLVAYSTLAAGAVNALHVVVRGLANQVELTNRLDKAVSQLIDANIGFQKYAATAGEESASQERQRVSRDIHDTAVHSLVNIIMLAESISDKISPDQTAVYDMLQMIIAQGKDAVGDTRQSLRDLRAIEEQPRKGLKAIHRLIKVFSQATGIEVGINYGNLPWEFGNDIDETIYRMIQEGMTNAFRHGKATRIQISLWVAITDPVPELNVSISDNGRGSQEVKEGIGLQGMEERLRKLGGSIQAKNVPGGFSVSGVIPLRTAEGEG